MSSVLHQSGLTSPPLSASDVGIGSRLLAGGTTGAMAVAFAQPTDVVKVRFQAQARAPGHARRYCGTIDAYKTIAKEEGIRGLWKGSCSLGIEAYCVFSFDKSFHVFLCDSLTQGQLRTSHGMRLLTALNW